MLTKQEIAGLRELLAKAVETPWVVAANAPLTIVAEFEAHLPLGGSIEPGHDARHYAWPIARMADPNGLPRWSAEQTAANAALIATAISALPALLDIAEAVQWRPIETAPMTDATQIIAYVPSKETVASMTAGFARVAGASLWMPLPVLPLAGEVT